MSTATTTRKVGDVVTVNSPKWPGQWRIAKLLPVNVRLENVATGAKLRCHPSFIADAGEQPAAVIESQEITRIVVGSVVTVSGSARMGDGMYVVLAETAPGKYRLAKLGGDNGRYWPSIDGSRLTVIDGWKRLVLGLS